jgi:hypothetical protein
MTKSATSALAQSMVPEQVTYADREQMLLAYRLRSGARKQDEESRE